MANDWHVVLASFESCSVRGGLCCVLQVQDRIEGMPVDSLSDILNGVAAVKGPYGVSLGSSKQDCAGA